jgi:hypothetical protein
MKSVLILFLCISSFSFGQEEVVYTFDNVEFMTRVPNAGENRVKRLALAINAYISSIVEDDYDAWYASFSDSTIARVAPHKFPNKFKRLKTYKIQPEHIKVLSVELLSKPFENEVGSEYELVIDFGVDLNVANRVSFDHLKRTDEVANNRRFGMNIVAIGKGYKVIVHKYGSDKKGVNDTPEGGQ